MTIGRARKQGRPVSPVAKELGISRRCAHRGLGGQGGGEAETKARSATAARSAKVTASGAERTDSRPRSR
ncbi:MAG: hypothetical protein H7226_11785 [Salinibacterium sp.]|nr:hypothetical protein [Salinibacterium sp.]